MTPEIQYVFDEICRRRLSLCACHTDDLHAVSRISIKVRRYKRHRIPGVRVGIVNCDDRHWRQITEGHTCALETYGFDEGADLRGSDLKLVTGAGFLGIDFKVSGLLAMEIQTDIPGKCASGMRYWNGLSTFSWEMSTITFDDRRAKDSASGQKKSQADRQEDDRLQS